jgi:hypothetical protein
MNLNIIYYVFINPTRNWKIIIEGQMKDLQVSNIPYDKIYIHICCEEYLLINE